MVVCRVRRFHASQVTKRRSEFLRVGHVSGHTRPRNGGMTNHPTRDLNALAGVPSIKQRGKEKKSSSRRSKAEAEERSFR
jgi:hypothetical protein